MLDQLSGLEEAVTTSEAGSCQVVYSSSQGEGSHPMWHPTDWMKQRVVSIMEDNVPWWQLVTLMTDGGAEQTLELAKCLLAAGRWRFAVGATDFCPLSLAC